MNMASSRVHLTRGEGPLGWVAGMDGRGTSVELCSSHTNAPKPEPDLRGVLSGDGLSFGLEFGCRDSHSSYKEIHFLRQ